MSGVLKHSFKRSLDDHDYLDLPDIDDEVSSCSTSSSFSSSSISPSSVMDPKLVKLDSSSSSSSGSTAPKRKRQRLTHLSADEKLQRRKLKNRVAAQSARDRKKARMEELEITLENVLKDNALLKKENSELQRTARKLLEQNRKLLEENKKNKLQQQQQQQPKSSSSSSSLSSVMLPTQAHRSTLTTLTSSGVSGSAVVAAPFVANVASVLVAPASPTSLSTTTTTTKTNSCLVSSSDLNNVCGPLGNSSESNIHTIVAAPIDLASDFSSHSTSLATSDVSASSCGLVAPARQDTASSTVATSIDKCQPSREQQETTIDSCSYYQVSDLVENSSMVVVGGQTLSQYDNCGSGVVAGFSSVVPSACAATACSDVDFSFEKIDQIFDSIIAEMSSRVEPSIAAAATTTTNPTATAATNYLTTDYQTPQFGSFDVTDNNNNSFEIDPNVLDLILADSLLNMEA